MYRKELFIFRTGVDVFDVHITISLNCYTYDDNDYADYIVQVYETKTHTLREMQFDNILAAKRRFSIEVEKATIFTNID